MIYKRIIFNDKYTGMIFQIFIVLMLKINIEILILNGYSQQEDQQRVNEQFSYI